MSHDVVLSVEQALEVQDALCRQGLSLDDLKKITRHDWLSGLMKVVNGRAEIKEKKHLIDCDVVPGERHNLRVCLEDQIKSRVRGLLRWDLSVSRLYISSAQKKRGKEFDGDKLHRKLANKPVLDATVLEYLLEHPRLIPEEWKGKDVLFWGTIYRYTNDRRIVLYIYWNSNADVWQQGRCWLDMGGETDRCAVVLANEPSKRRRQ